MSRITIDLRKRARERVHSGYDVSRNTEAGDDGGLYCYQLSHLRFRDVLTGVRSMPANTMTANVTTGMTTNFEAVVDTGTIVSPRGIVPLSSSSDTLTLPHQPC